MEEQIQDTYKILYDFLTTTFNAKVHTPLDTIKFKGTNEERVKRAFDLVDIADVIVADVSYPSHGQGIELHYALTKNKKIIFLGHSFGGRVIIKLNSRKDLPFEIDKVILVDSAGILPPRSNKKSLRTYYYKAGKAILSTKIAQKIAPDALENFRKKMGSADYAAASPLMRQVLVKVVNEDLEPLISNIKCPALLVWGVNDTATPLSDGEKMESLIPDAGLVKLENAGHYSFLEQQFTFNRVMCSFLKIGE